MKIKEIPIVEKYSLLSLLPYTENAQMISKKQKMDDLYLTQKIVHFCILALETFSMGNLIKFDAQVGENLCQIRAYKILHLAKKWLHDTAMKKAFQERIEDLINYQEHLQKIVRAWEQAMLTSKAFNKNLDSHESIFDFFSRHDLLFNLNKELLFIVTCYFLTRFNVRDDYIPVAINLKQFGYELGVSKYRAKRLSHHYQQIVCQLGCEFIMQIATELAPGLSYTNILPDVYKIADEDRAVLPCHLVSEIIFHHAILEKLPVLLKINRFCSGLTRHYDTIFFHLIGNNKEENQFSLIPCEQNLTTHCMVVCGEVFDREEDNERETTKKYIDRILHETPLKLILANTAIHPQYSGKRLEALRDNPFKPALLDSNPTYCREWENKLALMQHFALNGGCSRQNPTTFFLKHVYTNSITNELNVIQPMHTGCAYKAIEGKSLLIVKQRNNYEKKGSVTYESV